MAYKNIKTYKKGYLKVSNNNKIYFELSGNPKGIPILFVHGGPGGGFSQKDKRFFNPKKFNVICFDQRGSGKSKPFASLDNNTTQDLVEDIKYLLDYLKINKTYLFGGSWGTTLSLVYAISYPKTVKGLVLRGIFLPSKKDNDYFVYESKSTHPEAWENFTRNIPRNIIKNRKIEEYVYQKTKSKNKKERLKYTKLWSEFEFSVSKLVYSKEKIKQALKEIKHEAFARIELHYLTNNCFLPNNYIINNAGKIRNIPLTIIHGRYDCVCSPSSAYELHKAVPKSKLIFTLAGHSASDPNTEKALIMAVNSISK